MGKKNENNFKRKFSRPQKWDKREQRTPAHGQDRQKSLPKLCLREDQVAITEYVSDTVGFTGVLKARYSDFHVNEINLDGKVLYLNDVRIPRMEDEAPTTTEDLNALRQKLNEVLSATQCEQIAQLADRKAGSPAADDNVLEIEVSHLDKEGRKEIHQTLKTLYPGKLISHTVNLENSDGAELTCKKTVLRVIKAEAGRQHSRNTWSFPGQYVHFLVHKENMDTSEVACHMADRIHLPASHVNYCGTKDKRANTTQQFCVKKRCPNQIMNSVRSLPNARVGNFEFSDKVLKLGDLLGNRFRIALRHVRGDKQEIEQALQNVRNNGFINYFGLQRFGNCASVPTYEIGIALLKADYKQACELILKPRDNDIPFMRDIRTAWWEDRNSAVAARKFRSDKYIEKKLLDGLAKYGENDYATALRKIPRNMLMLYTHAFQSLIFNKVASRRIQEFGLKLMPGDLVYRDKSELDENAEEIPEEQVEQDEIEKEGDTENANDAEKVAEKESIYKRKVKPLTAEDISAGSYTLFDVVLPLPGYDIAYPANVVGRWYEELLEETELSSVKLRNKVKTYGLAGSYRKLIIQPTEMSWEFRTYNNAESTLISSDWEILKHKELPPAPESGENSQTALILNFNLPRSVYATMMLRELLKADTSPGSQALLQQKEMENYVVNKLPANAGEKVDTEVKAVTDDKTDAEHETNTEEKADIEESTNAEEKTDAEKTDAEEIVDTEESNQSKVQKRPAEENVGRGAKLIKLD